MSTCGSVKSQRSENHHIHRARSVCSTPGTPSSTNDEHIRVLAVDGCDGCTKLVEKTNEIRKKWREHCTKEVKKIIEEKQERQNHWEEVKHQLKNDLANRDIDIERLRAELDDERKKRRQVEYENSTKDIHLTRAKTLLERYSHYRTDTFGLIDQLVSLLDEQANEERQNDGTTHNDKNSDSCGTEAANCSVVATSQQTATDRHKKCEQVGTQTDSCQMNGGESTTKDKIAQPSPDIEKLVKQIVSKRIELEDAIHLINEFSAQRAKMPTSNHMASESVLCNNEPPYKRSFCVSSPIEDPTPTQHLQSSVAFAPVASIVSGQHKGLNSSTTNEEGDVDDDDILFVWAAPSKPPPPPSTPPLVTPSFTMNGISSNLHSRTF